jgi:hypothetical protein
MKLFIPLLCLLICSTNCSFSSSAYEKELEKCEKTRLLYQLISLNKISDPNLTQIERELFAEGFILFDVLVFQLTSCKDRVGRAGYVNGPLP